MKKEDLIAMGLTEDQAKKVMDSLDGNFVTKARFNEVNEENKTLKQSVADRDKPLEDLKKSSGDNAELKKQIETLQQQNADQKKAHDAEMAQLKLDNAIDAALTAAGAKNIKAVRAMIDTSKMKLGEDGTVEGLSDAIKAVQKSDSYMFNTVQQKQQTFKGFQPGASGEVKPGTEVDTSKMTYSELAAYMAANPDAKID
ncbi:phage scaffolding protein [Enterocloster asparagiformis]|uniref:Phage minor structural protein GP20 n=1 Tax=[Clostridium] asparagiforme DSM 15981 TaxID=518636 RepID=C0DAI7_9FIRM|nr:phage scaffolding protein [Enterocloster asparagiformis]EEG51703.1 phage minor structural protein GP20 [[Clostridium] asparagiforme DSM 15981]UWO76138.1 phage scaffolding protein [[Clostridium] asparagiforme DSM 15981]